MISSNEQKRLEELNKAIGSRKTPYLSSSSDLLPYDLVLLLTHHPLIRQLVRDIAAPNTPSAEGNVQGHAQDVISESEIAEVAAAAEKPSQALEPLQAELDSVRGQLAQLQRDKQALQASLQAEQQRSQDLARQLAGRQSGQQQGEGAGREHHAGGHAEQAVFKLLRDAAQCERRQGTERRRRKPGEATEQGVA